jgi:RNA polymerase sigma-54 factor
MGIAQRIELRQQQKLAMSPRLQQAIHVLQLSGPELESYLEAEAEKNPALAFPASRSRNDGMSAIEALGSAETRLEALHRQIGLMRLTPPIAALAKALAGELGESGYLRSPVFELADRLNATTSMIETALAALQACEPAGIGARSIGECLRLQLKARNRFDPVIAVLLDNLILIAKHDIAALCAKTGEPESAVRDMITEIRSLNPRPGGGLDPLPVATVRPEIEVSFDSMGGSHVALVSEAMPKLLLNRNYGAEPGNSNESAADFIHKNLEAAHWLVKALDQRAQTLLKVARAIVARQHAWFKAGDSAMRPLTLAMIADEIGVHESTVSRVTTGKYLTCRRGTYELKHFFSAKVAGIGKKNAFSVCAVRARIKHHIAQESYQKTLSDDALVNILREGGVDIARRTVAKYREDMGIPSSMVRRNKMRPRGG